MKKSGNIWINPYILTAIVLMLINACEESEEFNGIVTDIDGNNYNAVTIGSQIWMAENLKVTKYRNGDDIPCVIIDSKWADLENSKVGAYCYYNNDETSYRDTYGALYNWYVIKDSRNIAPEGWHIPSDLEWETLEDYLSENGYDYAGIMNSNRIAKALASTRGWNTSSTSGDVGCNQTSNNSTDFNALPAGFRQFYGGFDGSGRVCGWWSTNEFNSNLNAGWWTLNSESSTLAANVGNQFMGASIRCVKD
jgi:uncharacterized protein (TIGR02145 family)